MKNLKLKFIKIQKVERKILQEELRDLIIMLFPITTLQIARISEGVYDVFPESEIVGYNFNPEIAKTLGYGEKNCALETEGGIFYFHRHPIQK